jgi:hypothetical protein
MQALKRLDNQARRLEGLAEGPALESFLAAELAASPALRQVSLRLGGGHGGKEAVDLPKIGHLPPDRPNP